MYRVNTIFILNREKKIIDTISRAGDSSFFDDIYDIDLATGTETFEFSVSDIERYSEELVGLNYILFKFKGKFKLFQIKTEGFEHEEGDIISNIYCENTGISLINEPAPAGSITGNISYFFKTILDQTDFVVGEVDSSLNKVITVEIDKKTNVLKAIQDNISKFDCEIEFDLEIRNNKVTKQKINCYRERSNKKGKIFTFGKGIEAISKNIDWTDFCTAIYAFGKDDITVAGASWSVANGNPIDKPSELDYVPNMDAFSVYNNNGRHIWGYYESDAEDKYTLLQEGYEESLNRGKPKIDYEVKVIYDDDLEIGETVILRDFNFKPNPLILEARVNRLKISFSDETECKAEFANYKEVQSNIKQLKKEDILSDVFEYVNNLKTGILTETQIETLRNYVEQIKIENEEVNSIIESLRKVAYDKFQESEKHKVYGENVDVILNEGRSYYCQDVVKYIKFTAPSECSNDYNVTLTFRTEEGEPTKVNQDNDIWLTGDDCINGGLLIKCDSTYTINISLDNNVTTPRKFKGDVSKVYHGGEYLAYINKTKYCENVIELLQTYYDKRDLFVYSTTTPYSFKNPCTQVNITKWATNPNGFHIDCSSLTQFAARGITYINSIYNHNDKSPYYLSNKYKYSYEVPRFAADQAKYCIEQGWQLDLDVSNKNDWKKLQPGDIVFWKKRFGDDDTNATVNSRFMQVGHIAIVKGFNSNGDVHTIEATSTTPCIRNRTIENNYPEKLLFFARPRK